MLNQKLDYIHYNPVRCGYIDDPAHWRYSSYSNFLGQEGLLPIDILEPEGCILSLEAGNESATILETSRKSNSPNKSFQ